MNTAEPEVFKRIGKELGRIRTALQSIANSLEGTSDDAEEGEDQS